MANDKVSYTYDGQVLGIVPRSTKISDEVPQGTYTFFFDMQRGLWVESTADVPPVPHKVYGVSDERLQKVFRAYDRRSRNTGVLLSGEAGMGKSLFIRMIAAEAKRRGMPVFVVNADLPGITDWLKKCKSNALVILDEFEKTFASGTNRINHEEGEVPTQDKFLSLLDGIDDGKKLFVAAINDTWNLNKYMINRPGRFLYHFTFSYLDQASIIEFLEDNLKDKGQLAFISTALIGHHINYDSLACIVDEINAGEDPRETLQDLNLDREDSKRYTCEMTIDGLTYKGDFDINMSNLRQGGRLDYVPLGNGGYDGRRRVCLTWSVKDMKPFGASKYSADMIVPKDKVLINTDGRQNSVVIFSETDKNKYVAITEFSDLKLSEKWEYGSGDAYYYMGMGEDAQRINGRKIMCPDVRKCQDSDHQVPDALRLNGSYGRLTGQT